MRLFIFIGILIIANISIVNAVTEKCTDNLVYHIQFNNQFKLQDVCGNTKNLTCYNCIWTDRGIEDGAQNFNGNDSYIHMDVNIGSEEVTGCAWIRQTGREVKKAGLLVGENYAFHLWANGDGTFNYGAWTSTENRELRSKFEHTTDEWIFLCVSNKEGTDSELYINGILEEKHSLNGTLKNISYIEIGRHPGQDIDYFHGTIDEISIYNKALNEEEIGKVYLSNAPLGHILRGHILQKFRIPLIVGILGIYLIVWINKDKLIRKNR